MSPLQLVIFAPKAYLAYFTLVRGHLCGVFTRFHIVKRVGSGLIQVDEEAIGVPATLWDMWDCDGIVICTHTIPSNPTHGRCE